MKDCTFKPQLLPSSIAPAAKLDDKRLQEMPDTTNYDTFEYLHNDTKKRLQKIHELQEIAKKEKEVQSLEQCTFKPTISSLPTYILSNKSDKNVSKAKFEVPIAGNLIEHDCKLCEDGLDPLTSKDIDPDSTSINLDKKSELTDNLVMNLNSSESVQAELDKEVNVISSLEMLESIAAEMPHDFVESSSSHINEKTTDLTNQENKDSNEQSIDVTETGITKNKELFTSNNPTAVISEIEINNSDSNVEKLDNEIHESNISEPIKPIIDESKSLESSHIDNSQLLEEERTLLVVMQVQISKGLMEEIRFYDGDNIDVIVENFAIKHSLKNNKRNRLYEMLETQINNVIAQHLLVQ